MKKIIILILTIMLFGCSTSKGQDKIEPNNEDTIINTDNTENVTEETEEIDIDGLYEKYTITDINTIEDETYYLFFSNPRCSGCEVIAKIFVKYINKGGYDITPIYLINSSLSYEIFQKYGVETMPTVMFVNEGEAEECSLTYLDQTLQDSIPKPTNIKHTN